MARSSGQMADNELQHVTEEMYKRNAELNTKNKTLSLLHRLYQIAAGSLDVDELSVELTKSIAHILHLPFVAIVTRGKDPRHLIPESAHSVVNIRTQYSISPNEVVLFDSDHLCVAVLKSGKKKQTARFAYVARPIIGDKQAEAIQAAMPVKTTIIFPLKAGKKSLGALVLGIDRPYSGLNKFERQSISSMTDVVSVALDKAFAYANLRAANEKLHELDELKTEFLSIASHQLRTPLSIIKGYTSLLEEGAYGDVTGEMTDILGNIDVSNERLIKLVDEFLNISRLEQGRTNYAFEEMKIEELATDVVNELREKAVMKQIEITLEMESQLGSQIGDYEKLRHCLYNFVDNAVKYSPERTTVAVFVEKEKTGVRARVVDAGVGLDQKDIDNLFQKFFRSPNVMRDFQGTGLGLYVVRQFVEAHGGRVWAKSEGVGKGSEFGFWIPKKAKRTSKKKGT